MERQSLQIPTKDSYELETVSFQPVQFNNQVLLINPAMGVRQNFYEKFASFLSENGIWVYTYHYRGVGENIPLLKKINSSVTDWIEKDYAAMLEYILKQHPGAKIFVLGHSLGGQRMGYTPYSDRIIGAVFVAAQTGYWNLWNLRGKPMMFFLGYFLLPFLSKINGYYPGKATGMGENLPKNAILEWAKWIRSRNYLFDHIGGKKQYYLDFKAPVLAYSFADDSYAPKRAVEELFRHYPNASIAHQHIDPKNTSVKKVGHFGFFRKQSGQIFWEELLDWILKK